MIFENIIVIPYRKREQHLKYFLENSWPIIHKNMPNTKIVIVEQEDGKNFNRGKVLNIGFKEYLNKTKYFITHDVDINPTELFVKDKYTSEVKEEHVFGLFTSVYNTLGGIIKIQSKTIEKVNGFPNNIWGWGSEDKALQNRTEYFNIKKDNFLKNDKIDKKKYLLRFDDVNDRIKENFDKNLQLHYDAFKNFDSKKKLSLINSSGLNTIEYTIIERKNLYDNVELIKVSI